MYHTTACPTTRPNSAISTSLPFFHCPNASDSGAFEWVPSSFIFVKAGLSFICRRIQTEMTRSTADSRNGMRQPQLLKSASDIEPRTPTMITSDSSSPSVAVVWMKLV